MCPITPKNTGERKDQDPQGTELTNVGKFKNKPKPAPVYTSLRDITRDKGNESGDSSPSPRTDMGRRR